MRFVCFALILLFVLPLSALAATHDQEPPPDLSALFERGMAAVQASTATEDEDERDELLDEAIAAFRQMLVVDPSLVRVRLGACPGLLPEGGGFACPASFRGGPGRGRAL